MDSETGPKTDFEERRWREELSRRDAERAHDQLEAAIAKANEAAVGTGTTAMRTAVIINGGAALSSLAFIGNLATSGRLSDAQSISRLAMPLAWFAWGVALAGFGIGVGYLANLTQAFSLAAQERRWTHPYTVANRASKAWHAGHVVMMVITVMSAIGSVACFLWGVADIRQAISVIKLAG